MYIHEIKIDNLVIPNNIFLAPMAGVTDMPYRKLCRELGAGLTYTEMVSSKAIHYNNEKTMNICEVFEDEHPVGVQLFGSDPEVMGETAKRISKIADLIDINMGCPATKIVKNNEGSALMKSPKLVREIVTSVVDNSSVPVTVKIRKGFDDNSINAVEIAKIAEEAGAKLITVHGRTREQQYSGKSDLEIIKKVKEAVSIPVIGNGDITTPIDAKNMFDYTKCDGIMIARASMGNPWIFASVKEYLITGNLINEPSNKEKIDMALRHLDLSIKYKGEYTAVREMRKNLFAYIKNFPKATELRNLISRIDTYDELTQLLKAKQVEC